MLTENMCCDNHKITARLNMCRVGWEYAPPPPPSLWLKLQAPVLKLPLVVPPPPPHSEVQYG